jgi:hypothetical protein
MFISCWITESGGAMLDPNSDLEAVKAGGPKKMIGSVVFLKGNTLEEVIKRVKDDVYYTSRVVSRVLDFDDTIEIDNLTVGSGKVGCSAVYSSCIGLSQRVGNVILHSFECSTKSSDTDQMNPG